MVAERSRSSDSHVKPSPMLHHSTPSRRATASSPTRHLPDFMNWMTPTDQSRATARMSVPKAAVDLPFPWPVLTSTIDATSRRGGRVRSRLGSGCPCGVSAPVIVVLLGFERISWAPRLPRGPRPPGSYDGRSAPPRRSRRSPGSEPPGIQRVVATLGRDATSSRSARAAIGQPALGDDVRRASARKRGDGARPGSSRGERGPAPGSAGIVGPATRRGGAAGAAPPARLSSAAATSTLTLGPHRQHRGPGVPPEHLDPGAVHLGQPHRAQHLTGTGVGDDPAVVQEHHPAAVLAGQGQVVHGGDDRELVLAAAWC